MNVVIVEPGRVPYEAELNGLEEMQKAVGGLIQAIYPYEEPVAIVCNEEGLIPSAFYPAKHFIDAELCLFYLHAVCHALCIFGCTV